MILRAQSRVPTLPLVRGSQASTFPSRVPQTNKWCTGFIAHLFTSEASVTIGFRNWPRSKFSRYTSGLPNQTSASLIHQWISLSAFNHSLVHYLMTLKNCCSVIKQEDYVQWNEKKCGGSGHGPFHGNILTWCWKEWRILCRTSIRTASAWSR